MILSPTLLILLLERSSAVVPLRPSKLAGPPSLANILKIVDNIFANPVVHEDLRDRYAYKVSHKARSYLRKQNGALVCSPSLTHFSTDFSLQKCQVSEQKLVWKNKGLKRNAYYKRNQSDCRIC